MSKDVFNLIFGISTGVEAIAEAVCSFAIKDTFLKGAVLVSIPVAINGIIAICSNFIKIENKE